MAERDGTPKTRRRATENAAEKADGDKPGSEVHYATQLTRIKDELKLTLAEGEEKLLAACAPLGLSEIDASAFQGSVKGVIDWLGRAVYGQCDELSEKHRDTARQGLRAQGAVFEMKLATTRTAAVMEKQNAEVELKATMEKKLESTLKAAEGNSGKELAELKEKLEVQDNELRTLKMKLGGVEEALSMSKTQYNAMEKEAEGERRRADTAEALAKNHEEEMLRCKEVLEKALSELEAKTRKNATLEQRVAEFVEETAKLRIECDEARTCLTKALEDLGIVTEENISLTEQVKKLVAEAAASEGLRNENEQLTQQVGMLKNALQKLGEEKAALKEEAAKIGGLQAEIDALKKAGGAAGDKLAAAEKRISDLVHQVEKMETELEKSAEASASLKKAEQMLEESHAKARELQKTVDNAVSTLKVLHKQLKLSLPDLSDVLEALVESLVAPCAKAFEKLNNTMKDNENMQAQLEKLMAESAKDKKEKDALKIRTKDLEQQLETLQAEMADMQGNAGAASGQVAKWRSEMAASYDDVAAALASDGSASMPKANEKTLKPEKVSALVRDLIAKFGSLKDTMEKMQEQMKALAELEHQMKNVERAGAEKFKKERAALVTTALESMSHLRNHLMRGLGVLREELSPAPPMPPPGANPFPERAHTSPLPKRAYSPPPKPDELVLRLELPSIDGMGVLAARIEPAVRRGLTCAQRAVAHPPDYIGEHVSPTKMPPRTPGRSPRADKLVSAWMERPQTSPRVGSTSSYGQPSYGGRPELDDLRPAEPLQVPPDVPMPRITSYSSDPNRPQTALDPNGSGEHPASAGKSAPLLRRGALAGVSPRESKRQAAERKAWEPVYHVA